MLRAKGCALRYFESQCSLGAKKKSVKHVAVFGPLRQLRLKWFRSTSAPNKLSMVPSGTPVRVARIRPWTSDFSSVISSFPVICNCSSPPLTFATVPASEFVHRPLRLNGHWLPPVSYMQIPPDAELRGPIWDKLLGDIVLSMGRYIFPGGNRKLGFVTPHRDTEASTNFFGSIESRDKPSPTFSLWDAVEARLLRFLPGARHNRRGTMKYNPYEDPAQLGRVMREQGWWPQLLRWVSLITATKAVGRANSGPHGVHNQVL